MPCAAHPDRNALSACSICGRTLCQACLFYANSEPYCNSCVSLLEREHLEIRKQRIRRTLLAIPVSLLIAAGAVLGWRWFLLRTEFGMALFTPIVMIGIIMGVAQTMSRIVGDRSAMLFGAGLVLTLGVMLGGEYIVYDYKLFSAAQRGLSAEQLLQYSEQYTFEHHLSMLGVFDYLFFLIGLFLTWRRLWPAKSNELVVIRPAELEQNGS